MGKSRQNQSSVGGDGVGPEGERFVETLLAGPLGKDFVFANPTYRVNGIKHELCDVLILFERIAVVVQVKTAEPESKQDYTSDQWATWANHRRKDALKQLEDRMAEMLDGHVKTVRNSRQGRVPLKADELVEIYGVSVIDTPPMGLFGGESVLSIAGRSIPTLTTSHADVVELVGECSTPLDLIEFLRTYAAFVKLNPMLGTSMLDVLAAYKAGPEAFKAAVKSEAHVLVEAGLWEEFAKNEARASRDEADQPSFLIDEMIDKLHEARYADLPHLQSLPASIEDATLKKTGATQAATLLAKMRRQDRRDAGRKLIEKSLKCLEQNRDRHFVSMLPDAEAHAAVFLISQRSREERSRTLGYLCHALAVAHDRAHVVGYATEPMMGNMGFSIDAVILNTDPRELRSRLEERDIDAMKAEFGPPTRNNETEFGDTVPIDEEADPAKES